MYYAMAGISELEIPKEKSLVIYISECQNRCLGCHTPFLHYKYGDRLIDNFEDIFYLYYDYFDVLCLLGEGKCGIEEKMKLIIIVNLHISILKSLLCILGEIVK